MDLRFIKDIKHKIEGISKREKFIAAITLCLVVFIVPYTFLYSPSEKALKAKKELLQSLQSEITLLNASVTAMAKYKEPAPKGHSLPQTDSLQEMFMSISRQANALGVDFISIFTEGITQKEKFIEIRLRLELRVQYRQLYDFIRYLSTHHRLFLIESMRFETNDAVYPSGITLIRAVTYLEKK